MVKGLRSLERKLTRTIPDRVRRAVRAAMEKSADEIVAMAKGLVPVDSGDLKASIGWTWGKAPKGSVALAKSGSAGGESITIFAGNSEAFYARWVEFGTVKMPPSPYFFVSYRANKRRAKGRINRAIKKGLKEGAK